MRSFSPRAMVIVLGVLVAGPALASPAQDAPPSVPVLDEATGLTDRPMPSIPSDDQLLQKEDELDQGGGAVRVPITDIPVVEYDPEKLPTPVKRLREQIIEAAASGDPEKLRAIFDANGEPPALSFTESEDPIDTLRALSGDPEGREILAILIEVLEAGYVHVDAGTPEEMYIWPYFARYPVNALTPPQLVELFKLVFSGDYEDMKAYGAYFSYRVGIAPDGTWRFFLVGD
jgi:hypothetical protein